MKLILAALFLLSIPAFATQGSDPAPYSPRVCAKGYEPTPAGEDGRRYCCVKKCEPIPGCVVTTHGCLRVSDGGGNNKMIPPPCDVPWYIENNTCCRK